MTDDTTQGSFYLPGAAATDAVGQALAEVLTAGDTVLLFGTLGAGKSALARALIRQATEKAGRPEADIPSPTYTLVQTYEAGETEIWHTDLYRLGDPDEAVDLGLLDAMETAIVLIEWPERLGPYRPERCLEITLAALDTDDQLGRQLHWQTLGAGWQAVHTVLMAKMR